MIIKVLGGGCKKCNTLYDTTKEALEQLGLEETIEKVTDPIEIVKHGVMTTPALIIGNRIVSSGRLPSAKEIAGYIQSQEG